MAHADVWAVTPSTGDSVLFASAAIGAGGAITLITNQLGPFGCGYKILFSSSGDSSARTFTIVGTKVGDTNLTTEVVTAPGTGLTTASTNFFTQVNSISISGAATGNIKIGTTGSLALPRTRVKALHYVGAASAGSIKINLNSTTGTCLLQVDTPASVAFAGFIQLPGDGLLTTRSAATDFAIVTLATVSLITLVCG